MPSEANKFKLGLFVLVAIMILIFTLFVLGGEALFKRKIAAVTLFNESVQGLEVGSQVKMRGVPVGRVVGIELRPRDSYIQVNMELTMDGTGLDDASSVRSYIRQQVEDGLMCRLDFTSITGTKYIEIDYRRDMQQRIEVPDKTLPADALYIPAAKSLLASVAQSATDTLAQLAKVDFEGISEKLSSSLDSLSEILASDRLKETGRNVDLIIERIRSMAESLDSQLGGEQLGSTLRGFRETSEEIRAVATAVKEEIDGAQLAETSQQLRLLLDSAQKELEVARLGETSTSMREALTAAQDSLKHVETTMTQYRQLAVRAESSLDQMKLPETTEVARDSLTSSAQALQDLSSLQSDVRLALSKLNAALDQFAELVTTLEEDPAALLRGKQRPTTRE